MNTFPPREIVERLRLQYPTGCRVELVSMDDPYARLKPGDQGTVVAVDDIGTVHMGQRLRPRSRLWRGRHPPHISSAFYDLGRAFRLALLRRKFL